MFNIKHRECGEKEEGGGGDNQPQENIRLVQK